MKILIFYLSTENSHLPCRESLKNKLDQSLLNDIDLTVKDLTSFGLPEDKSFAEKMKSLAIQTMDAIFVIEKWQQEALTRIMDYSLWKKSI